MEDTMLEEALIRLLSEVLSPDGSKNGCCVLHISHLHNFLPRRKLALPGAEGQNKHQQSQKSADCCEDPGQLESKFVVFYCPLIQGGLEMREWDADCLNATNLPSGCQRDEFEANVCGFLPNCSISTCAKLNPTKGLISLEEFNCSVTLNWQDVINCCHEASKDHSIITSKSSWANACHVTTNLSHGQEYNMTIREAFGGVVWRSTSGAPHRRLPDAPKADQMSYAGSLGESVKVSRTHLFHLALALTTLLLEHREQVAWQPGCGGGKR
ncbi:hypothetical protein L345_07526, partial [Ophiophagus hannah]